MLKYVFLLLMSEVVAWSWINNYISKWLIFWACIVSIFIGLQLLRQLNIKALTTQTANQNNPLSGALFPLISGLLFIFPGFISDCLAILLLVKPIQSLVAVPLLGIIESRFHSLSQTGYFQFGNLDDIMRQHSKHHGDDDSTVIDGEAREVTDGSSQLEHKDQNQQ